MLELYSIGIKEEDLNFILEQIPSISEISNKEIEEKIEILKLLECNENMIRNIITSNPNYLTRFNSDIINLIRKLTSLGITSLNLFFDSNPFFLNKDAFEIDDYIKERLKLGLSINDIIEQLETNSYVIDEI